jgi:cyclopropane-fatty-acyl-phospholipid synthase
MGTADMGSVSGDVRRAEEHADVSRLRGPGAFTRLLARQLQRTALDPAGVRLELWDGSSPYEGRTPPVGDLIVRDPRTLLDLVIDANLQFGEAYMQRRAEIRGRLDEVIDAMTRVAPPQATWRDRLAKALAWSSNTLTAARRHVQYHYDLGNDFYQLWLDREMVYTCAYFPHPEASLEEAQRAKLDLVCRKLHLRPGDVVIEAGCGWGALALHMAREYGVHVKAFNVSREQLAFARARAAREGLGDRVEFIDDDYRNVRGQCDVFVSVGMLEHVGLSHYPSLSHVLRRTLKRDGGRGLLHFIGRDVPRPLNAWIRRRIFPGAYPPTLAEVTSHVLAPAEMSVLDVENLRLHYARTLEHWSSRFARVRDHVRSAHGDEFQRAWELYLAGSKAAFAAGWMQLFQVVFTPRESAPPSWTRAQLYQAPGAML